MDKLSSPNYTIEQLTSQAFCYPNHMMEGTAGEETLDISTVIKKETVRSQ